MPTSKETRVRVLDLAKIIAQVCSCQTGAAGWPRVCFKRRAEAKKPWQLVSRKVRFLMKCFMKAGRYIRPARPFHE